MYSQTNCTEKNTRLSRKKTVERENLLSDGANASDMIYKEKENIQMNKPSVVCAIQACLSFFF